jgi:transposase
VVCDIENKSLLEVIDSHKQEDIIKTLIGWPVELRESVLEVAIDMWGGFTNIVKIVFPNARITYDRFHVMKSVNKELNKIIKQTKTETKKLNIKHMKYILLKNNNKLTEEEKEKLERILNCSKRLREAYELKEEFRAIYETYQTPEHAKTQVEKWMNKASSIYNDCIQTVKNHLEGICNYFYDRVTSGIMEGINNKIKLIKRQAYGFINFEHLRMRLLACFSH